MYKIEIVEAIKDILIREKQTLSCAESVTAGHIQAAVSLATGAHEFFQGGITTYNLAQKTRHLHIDPVHALSCNCVSQQVAEEMATHTTKIFQSDWAIAITGYASPVPELGIENLFAFYAIAFKGEIKKGDRILAEKAEPLNVQIFYANEILAAFLDHLKTLKQ